MGNQTLKCQKVANLNTIGLAFPTPFRISFRLYFLTFPENCSFIFRKCTTKFKANGCYNANGLT